ncbi:MULTISPECIES: hypothetical protein [Myxococcaceae]|uniref:hypothetical protein n=1 Tax=Myxococcaceae TaxID=31 RepID=UPI00188E6642|nr:MULTISPECIES: hypothetical protein [Myxococcaceae]MBF5043320.1 hypothetical protein [Simulacricoccus sp. 17bor-14]
MPPVRTRALLALCLLAACQRTAPEAPQQELQTRASALHRARQVANIWPEVEGGGPRNGGIYHLTKLGDAAVFAANDGVTGRELWRTDGSTLGTFQLADIWPGAEGSNPDSLCPLEGRVYFIAQQAAGPEVWDTDGTVQGTRRTVEPVEGLQPSVLVCAADGVYIISGPADRSLQEVWRIAPGDTKAIRLTNFRAGGALSLVTWIEPKGAMRYIHRRFGWLTPEELWRTDGTPEGTTLVAESGPGVQWQPGGTFGSTYYFFASMSGGVTSLWSTQGTPETTAVFQPMRTSGSGPHDMGMAITPTGFFFLGDTAEGERALWVSDGTQTGTRIATSWGEDQASQIYRPRAWGERAVLTAKRTGYFANMEIWVVDRDGETHQVSPANGEDFSVVPAYDVDDFINFIPEQDQLLFTAKTPELGWELWAVDPGGTVGHPVTDIAEGPADSIYDGWFNVARLGDQLLFPASDGVTGMELWSAPYPLDDAHDIDAGSPDAGTEDAGVQDAGAVDPEDAGTSDAGTVEPTDAGSPDAGDVDAGAGTDDGDEGTIDPVDAGSPDAGDADAGSETGDDDAGTLDPEDAGTSDAGTVDPADAGAHTPPDAGAVGSTDAGTSTPDAGPVSPVDAGATPPPFTPSTHGCAASGGELAAALAALTVPALRSRRRRALR